MRVKKQTEKKDMLVLGYLLKYGALDIPFASSKFDITNLPRIIYALRQKGHDNIESEGTGKKLKYFIAEVRDKYKVKESVSKPQQKEISNTTN